jgi:hypothetical protein
MLIGTGEALYGDQWQRALARDLNVNDRTVRRWYSGESAIPNGIKAELRALLSVRQKKIFALIVDLTAS